MASFLSQRTVDEATRSEPDLFDVYRDVIEVVARWPLLAAIARRVHEDDRLSDLERERLFNFVDVREMAVRPNLVREPSG
ncbi:MAG TPA: hypothetical protein VJ326_09720 [Thermoplasmata archaeon]|nr:hypothetical protein [Thermoplasmata archaeon]